MKITPRINELDPELIRDINQFINVAADFKNRRGADGVVSCGLSRLRSEFWKLLKDDCGAEVFESELREKFDADAMTAEVEAFTEGELESKRLELRLLQIEGWITLKQRLFLIVIWERINGDHEARAEACALGRW